jgi:hypothetical protein
MAHFTLHNFLLFVVFVYFDQTATVTAIVVATRCTDHLPSLIGTIVKQFAAARCQLVQYPLALSFQVPVLTAPCGPTGSRNVLPSGVKVILNLVPVFVAAVNDCPVKNASLMSSGFIAAAALAMFGLRSSKKTVTDILIFVALFGFRAESAASRSS